MKALEGLRVIDLTHAHAGPICSLYMGAMGAEVIKIEPPWGEMTRLFPPLVKGVSPYFSFLNRCKKGVTLNLKDQMGKEIFMEMVKKSDIVLENFSPGTMDRLGFSWEILHKLNPKLIFASVSGFGQYGPWRDRRSFDTIAQATSGYMWLMQDTVDPDGPPYTAPDAIADTIPGLTCLVGILAALNHRVKTGRGQRVDVAQMDAMIATMQSFSFWNMVKSTFGNARSKAREFSGRYKAKDGENVVFAIPPGRITDWFLELLNVEDLSREVIQEWVAEHTVDEVVEKLVEIGVPVGPVLNISQVLENEHAKAREMFVNVDHPIVGGITLPGFPIKFSETKGDNRSPAPLLGQDNNEVYSDLCGFSIEEIKKLKEEGII